MTETPRDRDSDDTGQLGDARPLDDAAPGDTAPGDAARAGSGQESGSGSDEPVTGAPQAGAKRRRGGFLGWLRPPRAAAVGELGPEAAPVQRRRRRWFVAAISAGAALVVVALCAGTVGVVTAFTGFRDRTDVVREDRRTRVDDCLSLEQRLNKLTPPGATANPAARAVAVRDENAAVRIYVGQLGTDRGGLDGWRELLDARTAYAEALDVQAESRAPAFFVAPRAADGGAVTEQMIRRSPDTCAGSIRRLATPDL